jgi:hypothetical protein
MDRSGHCFIYIMGFSDYHRNGDFLEAGTHYYLNYLSTPLNLYLVQEWLANIY